MGTRTGLLSSTGRRFDIEQLLQQRVSEVHPCDLNLQRLPALGMHCEAEAERLLCDDTWHCEAEAEILLRDDMW